MNISSRLFKNTNRHMINKYIRSGLIVSSIMLAVPYISYANDAQTNTNSGNNKIVEKGATLNKKEQSIVSISAFAAKGDLPKLKESLEEGLNNGLTVNELKEVLLQLYAYTGFPRSLNALSTLMSVVEERKNKGIHDETGREATPLPKEKSRLELGTEIQTKLVGTSVKGPIYSFSPEIDLFLKEHLFADVFGRDILDFRTREIVTIAALASLGNVEAQLTSHLKVGMYNGLTESQLRDLISVLNLKVSAQDAKNADAVLSRILLAREAK